MNKHKQWQWPKKLPLATAICALSSTAFAQGEIEEVVVQATYQKSLQEAMDMKRESTKVADAISAKDLGSFPSENIAEAIQRIPGVQISNVNGRGAMISVRGLGPQYSRTTLNGQTFRNADFTSGFRFDIIQTELASGIQVIKSPSADMDAGGLSGTINIDTAKPLDHSERQLLVSAKGQKSEYSPTDDITPKANVTYIDQFADGTIGVMLNAGIQQLDDRVDNFWVARWLEDDDGNSYARRVRFRRIDRETDRKMFNGTLQWQPTDELDMSLTGVYASDDIEQDLNQQVFLLKRDYSTINYSNLDSDGYYKTVQVTDSLLENNRQLEERNLDTSAITADIRWTRDNLTLSSALHHTKGTADSREEAAILGVIIPDLTLDMSDPDDVSFTTGQTDLASADLYTYTDDYTLSRDEYPNGAYRHVESSETAFQFDGSYGFDQGFIQAVSAGVKVRREEFNRDIKRRDRYVFGDADPADLPAMADYNFMVTDFGGGSMSIPDAWIAPDIEAYKAFLAAEGFDVPLRQIYQSSYSIDRDIFATYVKADFEFEVGGIVVRGDTGLRYESTDRTLYTNLTEENPDDEEARILLGTQEDDFSYSNLLPSLNIVAEVTDSVQVRFAAAKVLVRPIITSRTSLAPTEDTSVEDGVTVNSINLGQPDLKPMKADQFDIGVEWYYGEGAGLTLNLFYKDVKDGTVEQTVCPASYNGIALSLGTGTDCVGSDGELYIISQTTNADESTTIDGFEIGWNQSFNDILPIAGFGVTANYTYITADNDDEDDFRLADLSEKTWNVTGYWENDQFSVRASLNHRSPYFQPDSAASFFAREGRTVDGRDQIDLTAAWNVTDNVKVAFGALNLLGKDEEAYRDSESVFQTQTTLGTNYYLGVTYQM